MPQRPGRPPLPPGAEQTKVVRVSVSLAEHAAIMELSRRTGHKAGAIARDYLLKEALVSPQHDWRTIREQQRVECRLQVQRCRNCNAGRTTTTDHIDNLQLLCGACNSKKGNRTQADLIAALRQEGVIST